MSIQRDIMLNVAAQCRVTALSQLASTIFVDGGSGTLRDLLIDAAEAIENRVASPDQYDIATVKRLAIEMGLVPQMTIAAYQDSHNPSELVATDDWENIDPMWHWMYRPLYARDHDLANWLTTADQD